MSRHERDGNKSHKARFVIDASGRSSFFATSNGWRIPNKGFERTAIWTHWTDVSEMTHGLEQGSALIIYLGGDKRGWIWLFPQPSGFTHACVKLWRLFLYPGHKSFEFWPCGQGAGALQLGITRQLLGGEQRVNLLMADPVHPLRMLRAATFRLWQEVMLVDAGAFEHGATADRAITNETSIAAYSGEPVLRRPALRHRSRASGPRSGAR